MEHEVEPKQSKYSPALFSQSSKKPADEEKQLPTAPQSLAEFVAFKDSHKAAAKSAKASFKEKPKEKFQEKSYEKVASISVEISKDLNTIYEGFKNPRLTKAMFRSVGFEYITLSNGDVFIGSEATAQALGEEVPVSYKITSFAIEKDENDNEQMKMICELDSSKAPGGFFGKMSAEILVTPQKQSKGQPPMCNMQINFRYSIQGFLNNAIAWLGYIGKTVKKALEQACTRAHLFFDYYDFFLVKQDIFDKVVSLPAEQNQGYDFGMKSTCGIKAPVAHLKEVLENLAEYHELYENFNVDSNCADAIGSKKEVKNVLTLKTLDENVVHLDWVPKSDANPNAVITLKSDTGGGMFLAGIEIVMELKEVGENTEFSISAFYNQTTGGNVGAYLTPNVKNGNLLEPLVKNMLSTVGSHLRLEEIKLQLAAKESKAELTSGTPTPSNSTQNHLAPILNS